VIGAAAEFAVGDELEAELFLEPDRAANGRVFGGRQFGLIDLAAREAGALPHQFRRTQKTADMLSAERWLQLGLGRGHLGVDIHGVALPASVVCLTLGRLSGKSIRRRHMAGTAPGIAGSRTLST
jgi:hypothetical protein